MNNLGIVDIKKMYTVDIIISQLNVSLLKPKLSLQ